MRIRGCFWGAWTQGGHTWQTRQQEYTCASASGAPNGHPAFAGAYTATTAKWATPPIFATDRAVEIVHLKSNITQKLEAKLLLNAVTVIHVNSCIYVVACLHTRTQTALPNQAEVQNQVQHQFVQIIDMDGAELTAFSDISSQSCDRAEFNREQQLCSDLWHEVRISRVSATMQQWRAALARGRVEGGAVHYPTITSAADKEQATKAARR